MKKILSYSFILGVVFSMAAVGVVGPTSSQVQAASNDKVDVFVSFDKTPGVAERAIVERAGGTVRFSYTIVPAVAASVPEAAIKGLLNNPNVTAVELDGLVYAVDAELENAWGVKRIGSGIVHNGGNKGTGVKIGIIDSGVDYRHQDLDGVYAAGGYDFVQNDADPDDVYGHGTHVAGTACAEDNIVGVVGVAPECALYSLRVLNDSGSGSWSATIKAMEWAVDNKLQVVNLSLGSSQDPGSTVKAAFDSAEAAGLVIVAAGGNSGTPSGKGNNVIYPAKYASVIAVAATDKNDTRPSWSSTGEEIELAAPGVSVLSSWNDGDSPHDPQPIILDGDYYKEGSGTSMASPHVAGAAALVIAAGITDQNGNGRINDEVRAVLNSTADDIGAVGKDTHYGYGLVNVAAAIASLVPPSPAVNVNVNTDKTSYKSRVDTTAVLTAAITDENSNAISGLSSSDFTTMVNGAATVVSFAETATPGTYTGNLDISSLADGNYTVEVTATDTRSISGSGTANFSVGPAPSEPTTAIVNSITYTTEGGKNSDKHLNIHIAVIDDFGNPVANASVSINLTLNDNVVGSGTGTTGSNGMVTFSYKNAPSGHYETKITGVTATGLTWDGATPPNGYDK